MASTSSVGNTPKALAAPTDPFVELNQRAQEADATAKTGVVKADKVYGEARYQETRDVLTEEAKGEATTFIGSTAKTTICAEQNSARAIAAAAMKALTGNYSDAALAGAHAVSAKVADDRDGNKKTFDGIAAAADKLQPGHDCASEPAPAPAPAPAPEPAPAPAPKPVRGKRSDN